MVVGVRKDLSNGADTKNGFFHTFRPNNATSCASWNLFMQRFTECFMFFDVPHYIYSVIFYGGVLREGQDTMFIHVVSYKGDTTGPDQTASLNMWSGVSYATSHSSKDMLSFTSLSNSVNDLYSLYYTAPFLDTATEINGTDNIKSKISSYDETVGVTFFNHAGGSRLYDTGDIYGD